MATTSNALDPAAARSFARRARRPQPLGRALRLAVCTLALGGCGGGSEVLVVPLFLFGFTDATNKVDVFFTPDQPTTPTGALTSVRFSVDGVFQIEGTGSYAGCTFTVTMPSVPAAPLAEKYNGAFTGKNVMQLTPTTADPTRPVLTLTRASGGGATINPPDCP